VVLALCGLAVALCGYGHLLTGQTRELFGVYRFSSDPPFLTPFGNRNHLAGFLALAGTVALGLALAERRREAAVGWGVAALMMGVAVLLTFSRGGIASFVVTWVAVGSLVLARRSGGLRAAAPWVIILGTLVFAGLLAFEQLAERAQSVGSAAGLQDSKLDFWPSFARAAWAYAGAGMGRGAFELGYAPFQARLLNFTFTHPENIVLQWWAEAGTLSLGLLLVLIGWVGRRIWRGLRGTTLELVAFIGLGGLLLHDGVDFALELSGPLTSAALVAGLLASTGDSMTRRPVRLASLGVVGVISMVAVLAASKGIPRHTAAEARLAESVEHRTAPAEVQRLALELIDRHPADWVLYSLMARHEANRGSAANALAWVNRVLFLRPADARAHVAAGHALLRLGKRQQALLEFKNSFELGDRTALALALGVAAKDDAFDRLLVRERGWLTEAHGWLVGSGAVRDATRLLEIALRDAASEDVRVEALVLLADTEARSESPARALEYLARLPESERDSARAELIRGFALWKSGRADEAVQLLETRLVREPGNVDAARLLVDVLVAEGRVPTARQVLERLRPFVTSQPTRLSLSLAEARLWETEGRWSKALELVQTASRAEPQRADLHYWVATLFERLGATRSAVEEIQEGRRVDTPEGASRQEDWLRKLTNTATPWRGEPEHL
jgi:tetratricopeptide (TPR) repeat protein/O-antigen ligase